MLNIFYVSTAAAVLGVAAAGYYAGWQGFVFAVILSVLEITLSFENAIVNAGVLREMDEKWRQRFLTWGIIIAVFGMRLVFPIALVAFMVDLNMLEVLKLALEQPDEYSKYLTSAHGNIAAFGGMFLLMVFLEFITDHKREIHWLGVLERKISLLGMFESIEMLLALSLLMIIQKFVPLEQRYTIMLFGIAGIVTYVVIHSLAKFMNTYYITHNVGNTVKRSGAMSFIYLECLDASFSFDGVIGAFAITKDIVIIMLGLGIGAFFVRSITIFLVRHQTLQKYVYLEHGAYYALGSLSLLMLLGIFYHVPEMLIGGIGLVLILLAFVSSLRFTEIARRK